MREFSSEDIRKKIPMGKAIELMKEAFVQLSGRKATVPVRTSIEAKDGSGRTLFMPSYSPDFGLFGVKMVSVFDRNTTRNLPAIHAVMLIMDGQTGKPLGLLEAEYLTALRTGAATGLASDFLSRKDSHVLAIFGTGTQAETQLEGVLEVRPIKEVIVFGRTDHKTISFCKRMYEKFNVDIHPAPKPEDLKRADIICTATTSLTPVFQGIHIKPGVHINGVGSYKPSMQEIPADVIQAAMLVVDQREAALATMKSTQRH